MNELKNINQQLFSLKSIIGFTISIICIFLCLRNFEPNKFLEDFNNIDYSLFILASLILIFSVFIRSIRWSLFFKEEETKKLGLIELFKNEMIGYFGNNIFPLKLGDLLRVSMMAKKNSMSKSYLLGTIVVERIVDILSLFLLMAIVLFFSWENLVVQQMFSGVHYIDLSNIYKYLYLIPIVLMIFYLFIRNNKKIFNWHLFISAFSNINNPIKIFKIILLSLSIWFIYLFNIIIISYSMGYDFTIIQSLLLLTFMTLVMIIPSAPGAIGTFQYSIILIMTSNLFEIQQFGQHEAMSFSIILHAYSYITYSIIGGYFFIKSNVKLDN